MTVIDHGATISSSNAQNHFGFAPFSLTITVEPQIHDLEAQPLSVQLVFEDGQQIDTESNQNNIKFKTSPKDLYIDSKGSCHFTVHIDTYSMFHDNRAFKLVFNLGDSATRHIRPCETKPFRLVKHRLEIVTEPDDTFFKDEGGRANCLHCKILLKDCKKSVVKNRDIPLTAKLVYEDMSLAQSSRDILEVLTQNLQLKKGQSAVDFRINEVSKNHNKRAFRVLFECKSSDALYHDISSCVTTKIMVKSKRTKKKGPRSRSKSGTKARKRKREPKVKKQSPSLTPSDLDSDALSGRDCDSDDLQHEPIRKKRRQSHRDHHDRLYGFDPHLSSTLPPMTDGRDPMDHTHFVPPALTGILPSIRPGALPRIAHQPPLFANVSKKNGPKLENGKNGSLGEGGVLGHMFSWCKLAGWVMQRLEWTHCGYEYDEATHSIDTRRPLYRCSFCLKYRNEAGWGHHEPWCQLKMALKEYEERVKQMHSEWNYQLHHKEQGGMTSLEQQSSPPPSIPLNGGDPENNGNTTSTATQNPVINGPSGSTTTSFSTTNSMNGPFSYHQQQSNSTLFSFQYQSMAPSTHSMPFGIGGYNLPPPMENRNGSNGADSVKTEKVSTAGNVTGNGIALPSSMPRIASVSRVHSQHGYDAFDANQQFLGSFDGAGTFQEADQLNESGHYQPTFDASNMLSRNQSDDFMFYSNIRNSLFDDHHGGLK